ncbi:MAG: 2-dehydropantoate 2-reductase [Burkholderiaceae bacterium]
MKICVYGTGAIGGLLGARLAAVSGFEVSAVARGAALAALREQGFRVRSAQGVLQSLVRVSEDARDFGAQDLVIVAVKATSLAAIAPLLAPLLGPHTLVLPAMNGVPWWFGHGVAELGAQSLESVDPGGVIGASIPFANVVGCVVHLSASLNEPGWVEHRMGNELIVGEPAGGGSDRVERLAGWLAEAGLTATVSADIRRDIWFKLWGNLTLNPVSAITGATADRILADPLALAFCSAAMREAAAVGARIGCAIEQSPEDRHAISARLGAFKTSMLQDALAGRPIELDAIVGAVREIASRLGMATPNIDALFGLARLFGSVHGLYPVAGE